MVPGYKAGGWNHRLYAESGLVDPDKPIRSYTKRELADFLHREPTRMKIAGINMTYEGLIPRIQRSMLAKDREGMQPHIREFVDRAVTFTTCPDCEGTRLTEAARSSKIDGLGIADACSMQISDLADWVRKLTDRRSRRCWSRCGRPSTRSRRSASATCRWTGPRAPCRAARRSA